MRGFSPSLPPGTRLMPGSPGFKPCSACSKPMPAGDPHESCLKCLGESHLADKCRIFKAFKPRTKEEWDFHLKQLLLEAALSPMSAPHRNLVPTTAAHTESAAPERPNTSKEPRHRTTPAIIPQRRHSLSPTLGKQTPGLAPPPTPLRPQPVQDRLAKSFGPAPAPSTPVPQGPSSWVAISSPVRTEVELTLPSTPDTFSAARDLIALTEPAPHQPSVPPMHIVPSRGNPAMLCPLPHAGAGRRQSRSRSRSQSRSRHRSLSWHRSQSQQRSSSQRRSHSQRRSRSTSRLGRCYYGSRHRSQSRGRSQHRSPESRSRRQSPYAIQVGFPVPRQSSVPIQIPAPIPFATAQHGTAHRAARAFRSTLALLLCISILQGGTWLLYEPGPRYGGP
ncbi:uncharacterized protein RBU57_008012 isoform 1-T2 [Macrochelys suwanniensis]